MPLRDHFICAPEQRLCNGAAVDITLVVEQESLRPHRNAVISLPRRARVATNPTANRSAALTITTRTPEHRHAPRGS